MKIVQTNKAYFPKVGGIETTITTLSEGLVNSFNADVSALVCNANTSFNNSQKTLNGVKVEYISTFGFISSLPISPGYFYALSKLKGDILHIHEPFPWADLSVSIFSRIRNNFSRIIVSWHSDIIRQKWVLSFYRKHIHKFLQISDRIIVSNPSLINNSEFLPKYKNKCEIIPIGIDLNWVNKNSNSALSKVESNKISLLFVGRLVYYKGVEYLIESMKMIKDAKLTIIGSGPLKDKIISQINNFQLNDRINILPEVDEETLHNYYKNCDLLILPSVEKSETYGIVQIEGMACGKPIICTEIGTGTTYINEHNITGLVVPPRNSKALAEAINSLISNDKLRLELGANGKKKAFKEFTSAKMVQRTFELYKEVLNN